MSGRNALQCQELKKKLIQVDQEGLLGRGKSKNYNPGVVEKVISLFIPSLSPLLTLSLMSKLDFQRICSQTLITTFFVS